MSARAAVDGVLYAQTPKFRQLLEIACRRFPAGERFHIALLLKG